MSGTPESLCPAMDAGGIRAMTYDRLVSLFPQKACGAIQLSSFDILEALSREAG